MGLKGITLKGKGRVDMVILMGIPLLLPKRETPSKGLSTSAWMNIGWSRAFHHFSALFIIPATTDSFGCFWTYRKMPANIKRAWLGCNASVWFELVLRQMGSKSLMTNFNWCQKPLSSISSQWATALSSNFCFFWQVFSAPTCASTIPSFHEITAAENLSVHVSYQEQCNGLSTGSC